MLAESGYGILVKEHYILNYSTDAKCWILDHAQSDKPFLVGITSKSKTIGHCIGVVQNMIVDAILINGVELSCESLHAVLGETVKQILLCQTYYPSSHNLRSDKSILSSIDIAHYKSKNTPLKIPHFSSDVTA